MFSLSFVKWLNGKHLLRAIIQLVKINSEARIHLPSRNWYQFADPERIAGLVSPEHVERHRKSNPVPPDCESGGGPILRVICPSTNESQAEAKHFFAIPTLPYVSFTLKATYRACLEEIGPMYNPLALASLPIFPPFTLPRGGCFLRKNFCA